MKQRSKHLKLNSTHHGLLAFFAVVIVTILGVSAIRSSSAATNTTGSFTCASNTTDITLTYTYNNAPNGIIIRRDGTQIYSNAATSGHTSIDGKAAGTSNTTYTYEMQGGGVILQRTPCSTKPKPATGSLSCAAVTETSITVRVTYDNPDTNSSLYRGSTLSITYGKGSTTVDRVDSGLTASTSYTYTLKFGTTGAEPSVTCTTSDPPAPPPPDTGSGSGSGTGTTGGGTGGGTTGSGSGAGSGSGSGGGSSDTGGGSSTPLDTGTANNSTSGLDIYSGGSSSGTDGSASTGVDGVTVDGSSSTDTTGSTGTSSSDSSNSSSTGSSGSRLNGSKTSATKAIVSALAVIGLMVLGFFGWLFLRNRRLNAEQSYDYSTSEYSMPVDGPQVVTGSDLPADAYAIPTSPQQIPLPPAAAPIASNKMESIINSTFYPGQTQAAVPGEGPKDNEPLDMFEVAKQYPTSFGNSHVISPLTPTAADLANMPPVFTPMPTTFTPSEPPQAEPAEPEPVAEADGTLDLHPASVTPAQTPAEDLIPLPPMPTDVPAAGDVINPGQLPKL